VGVVADARAQGRADAMAEMADAIEHHRRATDDMEAAARALAGSIDQLAEADQQRVHDVEQQVLQLAVAMAEEIIGREVRDDDGLVVTAAIRALTLAPDRGTVVLRVHPMDVAAIGDPGRLAGHLASAVQVVADPSIGRGGAIAEVGPLRIDAQISSALARIRDAFAP
jgi:flagellar assembly protein FliH